MRPRRELSNAYLVAKVGFDTAESGPCKVCTDQRDEALERRLAAERIYTLIGPILVAMNPFYLIPGLYDPKQIDDFLKSPAKARRSPHVFALACNYVWSNSELGWIFV